LYESDKELSIQKDIVLDISEYLDLVIKSVNHSEEDMPGFEKELKELYAILNKLCQ